MEHEAYWYHALAVALESNYSALARLKRAYPSWREAWNARAGDAKTDPEFAWQMLKKSGAELILADDPAFPSLLSEIPHPPFGLYVKNISAFYNATKNNRVLIAVVGTRKPTPEGKMIAKEFASVFAKAHCTIVSGLALGIDAAAHEGALNAKGTTLGILGCGIDRIYPSSNTRLKERVIQNGGAIVSEYPPGTPSLPYRFLERNRIVSGLSRAVVVIEAPERSGSLATARFAIEQNRDVLVVPGPAASPYYRGSHSLIRQGATLVACAEDALSDIGLESVREEIVEDAFIERFALCKEDATIVRIIKECGRPATADEIILRSGLDASFAHRSLGSLAIRGVIKEIGDRFSA